MYAYVRFELRAPRLLGIWRQPKRVSRQSLFILFTLFVVGCSPGLPELESGEEGSIAGLSRINYFREAVPAKFCGIDGYGYLLRSFIGPECGSCHSMGGGMFPPFGDSDLSRAYSWGRTMGKARFLETVRNNRFCGPDCNLDPRGEIYKAMEQWFENADRCN